MAGKKSNAGRPTDFRPEITERILEYVRGGHFLSVACRASGIHRDTCYEWLAKAKDDSEDGKYKRFSDALDIAIAEGEILHANNIAKAGEKDWKASAHFLRYRFPRRWGEKTSIDLKADVKIEPKEALSELLTAIKPDDEPEH